MTRCDAQLDVCEPLMQTTEPCVSGRMSFRVEGKMLEFSYRPADTSATPPISLPAPSIELLEGGMLDPSLDSAFVRVAPYPQMKSGDKLILSWLGLDADGLRYTHEISRVVSDAQVGQEVVFVIKGVHIAMLEGGSLELCWTLHSVDLSEPVASSRLQLDVGDPEPELLAPFIEEAVGGTLDPARVPEGASVFMRPYARMAAGDRLLFFWQGESDDSGFNDVLTVESFSVREVLSFWIKPQWFARHAGQTVSLHYQVQSKDGQLRQSARLQLLLAPLVRGELPAPQVLSAESGELDIAESQDGITVVIANANAEEGELVYLRCDGEYFNHRDDREITRATAGQPLVFIVPYRFWREHRETVVQVSYSVERLDDVSQLSSATRIRIRA